MKSPLPVRMHCPEFRREHLEYLDGTLSGELTASMELHRDTCTECAQFDVTVRRGLLVAWNLRTIEPSPGFLSRLHQRIAGEARFHEMPAARLHAMPSRSVPEAPNAWIPSMLVTVELSDHPEALRVAE